ncbi:MAG: hypothetical protein M0Z50_06860, partial [Planctomycetia bacterium]|nr:hypothetical protein [Planctomycetia bacterium]
IGNGEWTLPASCCTPGQSIDTLEYTRLAVKKHGVVFALALRNEIIITSTKRLYRLVREFRSIVRQIATGYAGGGVFNGNTNREVITVPFLRE